MRSSEQSVLARGSRCLARSTSRRRFAIASGIGIGIVECSAAQVDVAVGGEVGEQVGEDVGTELTDATAGHGLRGQVAGPAGRADRTPPRHRTTAGRRTTGTCHRPGRAPRPRGALWPCSALRSAASGSRSITARSAALRS